VLHSVAAISQQMLLVVRHLAWHLLLRMRLGRTLRVLVALHAQCRLLFMTLPQRRGRFPVAPEFEVLFQRSTKTAPLEGPHVALECFRAAPGRRCTRILHALG